ncbi:MAG: hypothetical protein AKCLJLPJ_01990 [Fimbriimonadales bacterium]|nr:hypothetical protein [Fimbriimonadales bacterium]
MRKGDFDPYEYIEQAFRDLPSGKTESKKEPKLTSGEAASTPKPANRPKAKNSASALVEAIRTSGARQKEAVAVTAGEPTDKKRLKRTSMEAPRPRQRRTKPRKPVLTDEMEKLWQAVPKNLKFLAGVYDDTVTQKYYTKKFRQSREDLIRNMVDPELTLEDASRLLGVCPATVRRYTNRGWLSHHRTKGNQRRFRLSGVVEFVEKYGRNPEG